MYGKRVSEESIDYTSVYVSGNARCQDFVLSIHFSFVFHTTQLGLIRALWQAKGVRLIVVLAYKYDTVKTLILL